MPFIDDVNRLLRDHEGYTGDGQGGVGPLPVGDRSTARRAVWKRDLRELLITLAQTMGDPSALQDILDELDGKADLANSGRFFTSRAAAVSIGQSNLPGTLGLIMTVEDGWLAVRSFSNASDDPLFETQPSWGVALRVPNAATLAGALNVASVIPLINIGGTGNAITADLAVNAVAAGASVTASTSVRYIPAATNSNDGETDVTLFVAGDENRIVRSADGARLPAGFFVVGRAYTLDRRGTIWRVATGDATRTELDGKADLANSGAFFTSRAAMVSAGQSALPGSKALAFHPDGDWLVVRSPTLQADDPLFVTAPYWGVAFRLPGFTAMTAAINAVSNLGDSLALQTDTEASTGQMIVASIPSAQTHISLSAGQMLRFRCPFANTEPDPVITVGGMEFVIKARNGSTLAAGDLQNGQRYLGYIFWNAPDRKEIRLSESVRMSDISGLAAALSNTGKTFTSRTAAVDFGQANLPGTLGQIITIEEDYVMLRGPSQTDDALFETAPRWGIAARLARKAITDALSNGKADKTALSSEADARAQGDSANAAAIAAEATARNAAIATATDRINLSDNERPGEDKSRWSVVSTGDPLSRPPLSVGTVAVGSGGAALRLTGADIPDDLGYLDVSPRKVYSLDVGRVYKLRVGVSRIANSSDPSGDSIEIRAQNLNGNKSSVSNVTLIPSISPVVADGLVEMSATISRTDATADYNPPATTRYFTPVIRVHGVGHTTEIVYAHWEDITEAAIAGSEAGNASQAVAAEAAARVAADTAEANARVAADRAGALIRLVRTSGDGNAPVYAVSSGLADVPIEVGTTVQMFWPGENTTAPTVTIGSTTYDLKSRVGGDIPPGGLAAMAMTARVISASEVRVMNAVNVSDIPALSAALSGKAEAGDLSAEIATRASLITDDGADDQVWIDPAGFVLARMGQRDGKAFLRAMGVETLQFDADGFRVVDAAGFVGMSFDGSNLRVLGKPVITEGDEPETGFDENGILKTKYSLPVWRKALGDVTQEWGGARILCLGDSLTAGGSLDYDGGTPISRRAYSYPTALSRILGANVHASWAAFTGTGGQGNAVDSYDPRIVRGSGWYANGDAPTSVGGTCLTNKTTTTPMTFDPGVTWSRAEVMIYGITAATVTISDGTTTSTHNVAVGQLVTVTHDNQAATLSPLSIVRTSGEVSVLSAVCTDASEPRVTVVNGGRGGAKVEDYLMTASAFSAGNAIGQIAADVVFIEFGINDQTAGVTPSTYKARMLELLTLCPAGADRVLIASAPPSDTGKAYPWSAYRAVLAEIAAETGLPLVDLSVPFGPRAQLESDGWNTDAVHLSRAGLGEKARVISKLLL